MSTSKTFYIFLKALILLSPLPFGCVGKVFSPLFYLFVTVTSLIGLSLPQQKPSLAYEKLIYRFFYIFIAFLGLQVIPLPIFLVKILSPQTVTLLSALKDTQPPFHPLSLVPYETLSFGARFLALSLLLLVLIKLKMEKKEIISMFHILIVSACLQVVFGFIKYILGNRYFFLFFWERASYRDRLTGTLGNPGHFAFYLGIALSLSLGLLFIRMRFLKPHHQSPASRKTLAYSFAPLVLGAGIILTGSRGGISAMILALAVFALFSAFLKFSTTLQAKLKVIFIVILVIVTFLGMQGTIKRFLDTNLEKELRFSARWPGTIAMISDFPISGTGFGTYRYSYYLYDNEGGGRWVTHAHNDYLETLSDGGIIGGVLFLSLIGLIMLSILKTWYQRHHPEVKVIGLGILAALFSVIFHSVFDFSLRIPSNAFALVLVLALGLKLVHYRRNEKNERTKSQ